MRVIASRISLHFPFLVFSILCILNPSNYASDSLHFSYPAKLRHFSCNFQSLHFRHPCLFVLLKGASAMCTAWLMSQHCLRCLFLFAVYSTSGKQRWWNIVSQSYHHSRHRCVFAELSVTDLQDLLSYPVLIVLLCIYSLFSTNIVVVCAQFYV